MNVHYYMQFFPGEHSPGSLQPFAFATALAGRGHDVTVISAKTTSTPARMSPRSTGRPAQGGCASCAWIAIEAAANRISAGSGPTSAS